MNRLPEPPAYGLLIEDAREKLGLSVREAARRAGISDAWWRYVVRGYQNLSGGGYGQMRGPADTVAAMARVVELSPERLESEGQRPDAAAKLRKILQDEGLAIPEPRHTPGDSEASDAEAVIEMLIELAGDRASAAEPVWAATMKDSLSDRLATLRAYLERQTGRTRPVLEQRRNGTSD